MYELMTTIKQCDERFRSMIAAGEIGFLHFPVRGQEVVAAALGVTLRHDDYLVTNYRGMHDSIAKGVSLGELWAEYLGKATGTCKGKGGPMHITDRKSGVMVTTGVVGSGTVIANGLAYASQLRQDGRVTAVTFGDGATSIGAFHEALNLAKTWNLPVVFLCQNNLYAEKTAYSKFQTTPTIGERASAYGLPGVTVDGNDALAIHDALQTAVEHARSGRGPYLVEAMTYRFFGHYFGDPMTYQSATEREAAIAADPVPRYRQWLIQLGHATEGELVAMDDAAKLLIDDAVEFALNSPDPDLAELDLDVYAAEVAA
ncbi:thiamine pyrophosphate-dependent dehydrogenase E1 component subunit alpha [Sporichthya sp.]|uniref:thiamine pyrophosphate-dependent dehydrogenase E1 component subunit alpha n=1 Tax=Sporichthya sp. TaxID=65475 RepID=UPI0025DBADFD|nr:thiamine pyrophosphate-dependent dehydrogenase E1 component subunit alpha [Sporichthya sp.]